VSGSTAVVVGEGWISEHYFTSDATSGSFQAKVVQRRKEWDAEAAESRPTPRSRFTAVRAALESRLALLSADLEDGIPAADGTRLALAERTAAVGDQFLDVLELCEHGLRCERTGSLTRVFPAGTEQAPLVVVQAMPVLTLEELLARDADTLLEPVVLTDDGPGFGAAARLVSALFVADDAPELVLLLAARWVLLAEQERWAEGRYLAVDLQQVCERNDTKRGGEIDRMLTCLSAASIAPDTDGRIWWREVFEDSVKHTVGVSQDLRDGVRLSIEIIANEVVDRRKAQGLPPLPPGQAQVLAVQSLRFLYRILFLLYAEASPHLGVLPAGAPEYDQGYSLDRLRELVPVTLATAQAKQGTHLYESLGALFRLVDTGHAPPRRPVDASTGDEGSAFAEGLTFHGLRADLFRQEATAHIDAVGLGNEAVQRVLRHLLLSKERRGRDRGFISYAELGINQLGAVYEGLMSYTGSFAETDLYEVAKGGDGSTGSWVVPTDRIDGISPQDFVMTEDERTGEPRPVVHSRGSFVFRLSGRQRQQSASYYTPEVLTRFTVGQALEELLDQDGQRTTAAEVLELTVCEPALGSGAFAIEAVRQLAEQYLTRRQDELGTRIDPDEYPRRLQEVKAYLALHNVYGVDLNATAVELAEISLWLDTMAQGLDAPWFGLHLRRGNSLIGARRAVYSRAQVANKSWLTEVPRDVPMTSLVEDVGAGRIGGEVGGSIHHFLLPAEGWGAGTDAKEAVGLAPDAAKRLKQWRSAIKTKPTKTQIDDLTELAHRVEVLWQFAFQRLRVAEREIRRSIPVWGAESLPVGGAVQREQIEQALADASGAYRRLRRVMDAWCALWFWPLTDTLTTIERDGERRPVTPPTLPEWIAGLQATLGRNPELRRPTQRDTHTLGGSLDWDELGGAEQLELGLAGAQPIETLLREHPWLAVCEKITSWQGFFHWTLEFAPVFVRAGGFDLQVGNPPWVRPRSDVSALMAEEDPWWVLEVRPTQAQVARRREEALTRPGLREQVVEGTVDVACLGSILSSAVSYADTVGSQPDSYRCFMQQTWRHSSARGSTGLIHPESHFTDEKAGALRARTYRRLGRHWQFVNELQLFEVDHHVSYGVHIYGREKAVPMFDQATSLYHPDTVVASRVHDGSGVEPGLKGPEGKWDLRAHAGRIITVDESVLDTWHSMLESSDVPATQPRMVYTVNRSVEGLLEKLARAPRIGELGMRFSAGWHETSDRKKGRFDVEWGAPGNWDDVILQGPHISVATPAFKVPNVTMLHKLDWSTVDLEQLADDWVPVTTYKPTGSRNRYDRDYTDWGTAETPAPARGFYRIAWRNMVANGNERSLMPSIIPPGASHVDGVYSMGSPSAPCWEIVAIAGQMSSLLYDFAVRVAPKSTVRSGTARRLPGILGHLLEPELVLRTLRLNATTRQYRELWAQSFSPTFATDRWTCARALPELAATRSEWTSSSLLRSAAERRQALLEIDALVALMLRLNPDELCTVYRTQFPVLYGYDRNVYYYDANGRLVPNSVLTTWRRKGDRITEDERTATNQAGNTYTYELPFVTLDREHDMRVAYAEFERRLAERS
jgi:hypothetical protein